MTCYAYADRGGVISFGAQLPTGDLVLVIAKSSSSTHLRDVIASIAQLDRAAGSYRVPSMSSRDPGEVLAALGRFQVRVERRLLDEGGRS